MTAVVEAPDLLTSARANDPVALETMFRQFIDENEEIIHARFLGRRGVFGFGPQCFAAVTNRRVASIQYSKFGEVVYQDGFLNKITSSVVYQPSRLWLILIQIMVVILAVPTLGLALLFGPVIATFFYAIHKSGVAFVIGDGIPVFLFCDRKLIRYANELQRIAMELAGPSDTKVRPQERAPVSMPRDRPEPPQQSEALRHPLPLRPPQGSNRVRVTDEGLTRWCIRFFWMALLGAIVGSACGFQSERFMRQGYDYDWESYRAEEASDDRRYSMDTDDEAEAEASGDDLSETVEDEVAATAPTNSHDSDEMTLEELSALAGYYDNLGSATAIFAATFGIVGGISLIAAIVTFIWWVGRRCNQVPAPFRRVDGGTARVLLSIPVVNLIGTFFTLPKLADSYDAAADHHVDGTPPPSAYGIGVAICIVTLLPFVNLAVNPFLIRIYLRRIEAIRSEITGSQVASA